jgi:hypothetical protein
MIEHIESPSINGLQGYLQCIKRLCTNGYAFGAVAYKANSDIDEFISGLVRYWGEDDGVVESDNFEYCGKELISYEFLLKKLKVSYSMVFWIDGICQAIMLVNMRRKC